MPEQDPSKRLEAIRERWEKEVERLATIEAGAWALVHRFEQWPSSPSLAVAARHLREVLAPVAPDAEPTEWVWSPGDVVLDADLIAWQRDGERIHYPWLAVGQPVQRDQDITEHVTKHGGRVLVCKARGIGTEPPC